LKQGRFPLALFVVVPLLLAGCEQKAAEKPASAPAAAPAPAATPAPAAGAKASGPGKTVGFELVDATAVGALQFDVAYVGEGRFVGDADAVQCETKVSDGALSAYNHIVDQKQVRVALVSVKGFTGPVRVSQCQFQGDVKASDFTVTVKDSSSPDLAEITPAPTVKVVID
jgi:hypothetical protein